MGELTEAELLAHILPVLGGGDPLRLGPGDDAAVLDLGPAAVVTTDSMVRGLDWRDDWSSPADVAAKLLVSNLADVAAMGATARAVLVSLILDPLIPLEWVLGFATALGEQCRRYDVAVAGGDLSAAPPGVGIAVVTAMGVLGDRDPVTRAGARPGDVVAVTGPLGRSAVGLALLDAAEDAAAVAALPGEALAHHRRPSCPLSQGPAAAAAGARAMIDISDGLLRDAERVATASDVAVAIDSSLLAADLNWAERYLPRDRARACVLGGGEEHSLLATFPADSGAPAWWRVIGEVRDRADAGGGALLLDGRPAAAAGWDHFAGRSARTTTTLPAIGRERQE